MSTHHLHQGSQFLLIGTLFCPTLLIHIDSDRLRQCYARKLWKEESLLGITKCGMQSDGEMNFALNVWEVEGPLETLEIVRGISIGGQCKIIPVRSIPVFWSTHAVRHDHDRIGLCDRMREECICVKPSAKDFQFNSAFLKVLLGHSLPYSPSNRLADMYDYGKLPRNLSSEANNRSYIRLTTILFSIAAPKFFVDVVVAVTHRPKHALPLSAYIEYKFRGTFDLCKILRN